MSSQYDPFLFPPNHKLAQLHKHASMPGTSISPPIICPCCNKKQKQPYKNWINRSIDYDFRNFGGSVVTYFWLLKLYIGIITLILIIYSVYLTKLIQQNCSPQIIDCKQMFGIWIISNQSLVKILRQKGYQDRVVRLLTLRGVAFAILMLTNAASLLLVKKYKKIHPNKINISDYSILFKNTKLQPEEMILTLKKQFPDIQIKQVLKVHKLQPFYTLYQQKLDTYFQALRNQDDQKTKPKEKQKVISKLIKLNKQCAQAQQKFHSKQGEKIFVTFQTIQQKKLVLQKYNQTKFQKFINIFTQNQSSTYAVEAPQPQEIIWNNIGSGDKYKTKYKILSIVYFLSLLAACYFLLYLCMAIVYQQWFQQPWNQILINIILISLVSIGLTFRSIMNKLSQLSHPSTYTNRTMFIVLTTISFHLIFYLLIPTGYFSGAQSEQHRNQILKMISNQVFNFVIFQFIIVGVDLMHCFWNRKLKVIQNQQKPYACQYILHNNIQYPRFPIQFKLIILFKVWSFTMFFSFQSPFILMIILIVLIFLFLKDKHSLYFHYRMQIIDNKVQFKYLRIYTVFFSIYGFIVFVLTQHLEIQFWLAAGFTVIMIIIQFFWIGGSFQSQKDRMQVDGSLLLPPSFDQLQNKQSYRKAYKTFVQRIQNQSIDIKINQFLGLKSVRSLKTQDMLM